MPPEIQRIVAIGDSPRVTALRQDYPNAEIVELSAPARCDPAELIETIRAGRYDAAFIYTDSPRSPWELAYCCYLAGVPKRYGTSREFGGALLSNAPERSE